MVTYHFGLNLMQRRYNRDGSLATPSPPLHPRLFAAVEEQVVVSIIEWTAEDLDMYVKDR